MKANIVLCGPRASGKTFIAESMLSLFNPEECIKLFAHQCIIPPDHKKYKVILIDECKSGEGIRYMHLLLLSLGYTGSAIYITQDESKDYSDDFKVIECVPYTL